MYYMCIDGFGSIDGFGVHSYVLYSIRVGLVLFPGVCHLKDLVCKDLSYIA